VCSNTTAHTTKKKKKTEMETNTELLSAAINATLLQGVSEEELKKFLGVSSLEALKSNKGLVYNFSAFQVCGHKVLIVIKKSGEVTFTVDGFFEAKNVDPVIGGLILRRMLSAWKALVRTVPSGTELNCDPYVLDGQGVRRQRIYERVGFKQGKFLSPMVLTV
jgi:hypothetical protein